jgi:hypothetical protein
VTSSGLEFTLPPLSDWKCKGKQCSNFGVLYINELWSLK